MNIFITGGTGFIGSHLIKILSAKGFRIFCLTRNRAKEGWLREKGITPIFGDIRDASTFIKDIPEGIDIVYHLAGILGRWNVPNQLYRDVHIRGTENLLNACSGLGIRRFVFCSSVGVLGPSGNYVFDENSPYNPTNIYEFTKCEAEKLVLSYAKSGKIDATVIRPSIIYGPEDFHMLGLFRSIKKGLFPIIDNGRALFQPAYIADIVRGFESCFDRSTINQIYILAGKSTVAVKELVAMMAKLMKIAAPRIKISKSMANFIAPICEISGRILNIEPPLTRARIKFFTENKIYNINKAMRDLGCRPINLQDGLKITIDWYLKNNYL